MERTIPHQVENPAPTLPTLGKNTLFLIAIAPAVGLVVGYLKRNQRESIVRMPLELLIFSPNNYQVG